MAAPPPGRRPGAVDLIRSPRPATEPSVGARCRRNERPRARTDARPTPHQRVEVSLPTHAHPQSAVRHYQSRAPIPGGRTHRGSRMEPPVRRRLVPATRHPGVAGARRPAESRRLQRRRAPPRPDGRTVADALLDAQDQGCVDLFERVHATESALRGRRIARCRACDAERPNASGWPSSTLPTCSTPWGLGGRHRRRGGDPAGREPARRSRGIRHHRCGDRCHHHRV